MPTSSNAKKVRNTNNAPFIQTRRYKEYELKTQSDSMKEFLKKSGGRCAGGFQRLGDLKKLIMDNETLSGRLEVWIEDRIETMERSLIQLSNQYNKLKEDTSDESGQSIVPDSYKFTMQITHPIFYSFIGMLEELDKKIAAVEDLWLSGYVEDNRMDNAKRQTFAAADGLMNKIYTLTDMSRTRQGGIYNHEDFKKMLSKSKREQISAIEKNEKDGEVETVDETQSKKENENKAKPDLKNVQTNIKRSINENESSMDDVEENSAVA